MSTFLVTLRATWDCTDLSEGQFLPSLVRSLTSPSLAPRKHMKLFEIIFWQHKNLICGKIPAQIHVLGRCQKVREQNLAPKCLRHTRYENTVQRVPRSSKSAPQNRGSQNTPTSRFSGNNLRFLEKQDIRNTKATVVNISCVCNNLAVTMHTCKFKHKDATFPFSLLDSVSKKEQLFAAQP